MKKLLGISLVAALAVAPSLANAAGEAVLSQRVSATANTNVATTSYVQGAYNAAVDVVAIEESRAKGVEGSLTNLSESFTGTERDNLVNAINAVAADVATLDSTAEATYQLLSDSNVESDGEGDLHYIEEGNGVASNLKALDDQVYANTGAISTETSNRASEITRVEGLITSEATTRANADTAINNKIGTLVDGTYTAGQTVGADIDALDTALSTLSSTMNGDFATKEGVVATINHSTASGTVTVYDTWNSSSSQPITVSSSVSAPGASHNEYYATLGAATGTAQTDTTPNP